MSFREKYRKDQKALGEKYQISTSVPSVRETEGVLGRSLSQVGMHQRESSSLIHSESFH